MRLFGAWLLVAGPIFQASVELREEDAQTGQVGQAAPRCATVDGDTAPRPSRW